MIRNSLFDRHMIGATLLAAALCLGLPLAGMAQTASGTAPGAASGTAPAPAPASPTPRQPSAAQAAQQERMRDCNAEAGKRSLAGGARRPFMSECLAGRMPPAPAAQPSAAQPSAAQAAQRERMTSYNAEAGTRKLAAEPRRSFMRDCLAGGAPASSPSPSPAAGGGPRG
jgi:hypothetical protein